MSAMEAQDLEGITGLVTWVGSIAGIGSALASIVIAIYRKGYNAGREAERRKQEARTLRHIDEQLGQ